MKDEILKIGYFQLENLMLNQVQFFFVDIRENPEAITDEPIRTYVSRATLLDRKDVSGWLNEKASDLQVPVILLCEDGERSHKLAQELSDHGYVNIYILENGLNGLLEEGQSLTHS